MDGPKAPLKRNLSQGVYFGGGFWYNIFEYANERIGTAEKQGATMSGTDTVADRQTEQREDLACCEEMARAFKALANPTRLGILRRIIQDDRCVGDLQEALDRSQPNISQHLGVLRDRGVVEAEREGTRVRYRPADPRLAELLELAAEIFEIEHP
jgi:ArsR family transcriptional regulator